MQHSIRKPVMAAALLILLIPFITSADHRNRNRIDRDNLDDDVVKSFAVPVLFDIHHTQLVADFGDPRDGGTRDHEGQDMFAPEGTPIVSPTEAIVSRIGEGTSAGLYVYTAIPGGETLRYMHLETIADIDEGDELKVGDFIGTLGDTGNAVGTSPHLHFEVRDEDNDPVDPYTRLTQTFELEDRMDFLDDTIDRYDGDEDQYAVWLVETFESDFAAAIDTGYDDWPNEIEDALEDTDMMQKAELLVQFNELIDLIPSVLQQELTIGDESTRVGLLQTYLLFRSSGAARTALAGAGATGYYGSITAAAVREWQAINELDETGVWDEESWEEAI